ncbi:MAG: AAA family ATPase [Pseudonocardiaceae bacterium]
MSGVVALRKRITATLVWPRQMTPTQAARAAGGFVRQVRLDPNTDTGRYPFTLSVVQHLSRAGGLDLDGPVTFLVGDNGTGKSTLIEALAVAAGFNAEGGSQAFRFATRATESSLGDHLVLRWGRKPRTGFVLRAESFYNVALLVLGRAASA